MKLNVQEGAEMEGFVMKDASVSVLMGSMDHTVRKVKNPEHWLHSLAPIQHRCLTRVSKTSLEIIFSGHIIRITEISKNHRKATVLGRRANIW